MLNGKIGLINKTQNNELYVRLSDVEKEITAFYEYNQDAFRDKTVLLPCDDPKKSNFTKFFAKNFENFGLKKLISTSPAFGYSYKTNYYQNSFLEKKSDYYILNINKSKGKIFAIDRDTYVSGLFEVGEPEWLFLEGDGDFRSDEIVKFRDEADIIITYPPCSLIKKFLFWIYEADKKFIVIADKACLKDEDISSLIENNKMWFGKTDCGDGFWFETTYYNDFDKSKSKTDMEKIDAVWLTNIEYGNHQ